MKGSASDRIWIAASLLLGFVVFVMSHGFAALDPTQARDFVAGDSKNQLMGWWFYRNEPWTFPLGKISHLYAPIGAVTMSTDSLPWLAVFFKLLDPWLPPTFHYFNLWNLSCYLLQAWFGYRIFAVFLTSPWMRCLGSFFLVIAPALTWRQHFALRGHWVLLAGLALIFAQVYSKRVAIRFRAKPAGGFDARSFLLLTGVSAGLHPYLWIMAMGLMGAAVAIDLRWVGVRRSLERLGVQVLVSAAVLWVLGAFWFSGQAGREGYGFYKADLITYWNPLGMSFWMPSLYQAPGSYEGYAYLGAAGGVLSLVVLARTLRNIKRWCSWSEPLFPLVILATGCSLYAYTNTVDFMGSILIRDPLPYLLGDVRMVFRASGRFIWVPMYLILVSGYVWIARRRSHSLRALALVAVVGANFLESPLFFKSPGVPRWASRVQSPGEPVPDQPTAHENDLWSQVHSTVRWYYGDHLFGSCNEKGSWSDRETFYLQRVIALRGLRTTYGGISREPVERLKYFSDYLHELSIGPLRPDSVYLLPTDVARCFRLKHCEYVSNPSAGVPIQYALCRSGT